MDNYEEKYKKALAWMQSLYKGLHGKTKEEAEEAFPELKESEGERIRKALMQNLKERFGTKGNMGEGLNMPDVLAWLEKQGEQKSQRIVSAEAKEAIYDKPAWSEEDENMLKVAIESCEQCGNEYAYYWLKSLKNRVQPKPKQEWSEEDEKEVAVLEAYIRSKDWSERHVDRALGIVDELANKVKSLRPQSQWKPSDEQMGVIEAVINNRSFQRRHLDSLYNDLKKLKGE